LPLPRARRSTRLPYTTLFRSPVWLPRQEIRHRPSSNERENVLALESDVAPHRPEKSAQHETKRFGIFDLGPTAYEEKPFGDFLRDRKSTRLNSSHVKISYAVF